MKRSLNGLPVPSEREMFAEWSRKLKQSDHHAFEEVYSRLKNPLTLFARSLTGDGSLADDVVHDVFVKLWIFRSSLRPDGSLKSYLYAMVRNEAFNQIKRRQSHARPSDLTDLPVPATEPTGEEWLDYGQLYSRLESLLTSMPVRRREAFLLSRQHGLSHEQIAHIMRVNPPVVNVYVVRAMNDLRAGLDAFYVIRAAA